MKQKLRVFLWSMTSVTFVAGLFCVPASSRAQVQDVFVTNMPSVSGSAVSAAEELERRYHLNLESMQNQGENFNVSSQKGQAPQMLLYFSPSDPKPGVEVEARAFPQYFQNPTESLYFTWYIRRQGCDLDENPGDQKRARCDHNDDRRITVEDWKIEAMQIVVARDFDSTCSLNGSLSTSEREECAENMYNPNASSRINPSGTKGRDRDEDGYRATFGGDQRVDQEAYCYIHDFNDGYNYELPSCKHLFPDNYYLDSNDNILRYPSDDRRRQVGGGDAAFEIEEEHFWRTDPEDPSTAQNGNKDEANLAGLGQNTFKWIYAPEDMVGVVVEGASMYHTKYDDSSMMIMWALPKNDCPVTGKGTKNITTKGFSDDATAQVEVKTASNDLDACLEDNLVDPAEGGQSENLDLSLSFTPDDPSAKLIPWSDSGASAEDLAQTADTLTVNASSANAKEGASFTNYTWRVQASRDGTFNTRFSDGNTWDDITCQLLGNESDSERCDGLSIQNPIRNISAPNGNNITSLSINLNLDADTFGRYFNDDIAYFRISVSAAENFSGRVSQSGSSSVVVKIVANKSIDVYSVETVTESSGLVRVRRAGNPFCVSNTYQQTICPVLNNEILGVVLSTASGEVRDYAWTLNGEALVCSSRVSNECSDDAQGDINFFPIVGKVGDMYILTVSANNAETGKSFTVSRRFQIVDPDFDIVSQATELAWPKYLGKYVNLDGTESNDVSKTSFEGVPGAIAEFSAVFRPEVLGRFILDGIAAGDDQNEMIWSIDGKPFKWNDTGLSVALDGRPGDIRTITLSGAYNQPRELRKALYDIWRVSPFSSETVRFSKEIQIRLIVEEGEQTGTAKNRGNTFFASLISAVPPVVLFSVRLILSMGIILLIVGVTFAMMPEGKGN